MLQGVGKIVGLVMTSATLTVVLFFASQPVRAQENATTQDTASNSAPASAPRGDKSVEGAQPLAAPAFAGYKGVKVGMGADEVRGLLGGPKEKSKEQDFYAFSERESARVFYDKEGKVSAVAVTYFGKKGDAPEPAAVFGKEVEAKDDGSLYQRETYKGAGYWVSYSRTAGDEPVVIVTMQKMP